MKYIPKRKPKRGYDPHLVIELRKLGLLSDRDVEEYLGKAKAMKLMRVTG